MAGKHVPTRFKPRPHHLTPRTSRSRRTQLKSRCSCGLSARRAVDGRRRPISSRCCRKSLWRRGGGDVNRCRIWTETQFNKIKKQATHHELKFRSNNGVIANYSITVIIFRPTHVRLRAGNQCWKIHYNGTSVLKTWICKIRNTVYQSNTKSFFKSEIRFEKKYRVSTSSKQHESHHFSNNTCATLRGKRKQQQKGREQEYRVSLSNK